MRTSDRAAAAAEGLGRKHERRLWKSAASAGAATSRDSAALSDVRNQGDKQ